MFGICIWVAVGYIGPTVRNAVGRRRISVRDAVGWWGVGVRGAVGFSVRGTVGSGVRGAVGAGIRGAVGAGIRGAVSRGEKILLLAYARSCQHMGESETAINAAPRAVSELRKSNFIPRELSSFLKESVKTAHFNLIAASL